MWQFSNNRRIAPQGYRDIKKGDVWVAYAYVSEERKGVRTKWVQGIYSCTKEAEFTTIPKTDALEEMGATGRHAWVITGEPYGIQPVMPVHVPDIYQWIHHTEFEQKTVRRIKIGFNRLRREVVSRASYQMTPEQWYAEFLRTCRTKKDRRHWTKDVTDPEWTVLIFEILGDMGTKLGFFVGGKPGRKPNRWDQTWFDNTGRPMVVVEHENDGLPVASLESELDHLLYSNCPLRVLITYFSPKRLERARAELTKRIEERLESMGTWDFKLLVLTASWGKKTAPGTWSEPNSPQEYQALVFYPEWANKVMSQA